MLKLPKAMSAQQKSERALEVAEMLGLTHALDSVVGSSLIKVSWCGCGVRNG